MGPLAMGLTFEYNVNLTAQREESFFLLRSEPC